MAIKKIRIGVNGRMVQEAMSGIPRFTINLIEELAKPERNCEIHLFILKRSFAVSEIKKRLCNNPRIIIHVSSWSGRSYVSRMLWDLMFLGLEAKRQRFDVFFGPSFTVPLLISCPSVVLIYDLVLKKAPNASRRFFSVLFEFFQLYILNPIAIRKAKIVVTCSKNSQADLIKEYGIPKDRIKVIYGGVEPSYRPLNNENAVTEVLSRLNVKQPYILYPSGFIPRKNQMMLIEAFARFNNQQSKSYQLVVFGSGERQYIKQVQQRIKYFGLGKNISMLPFVSEDDLVALYNGASLCVYPSLYEGFGIPLLEAMACGTPVVASNVSSLPEVVGEAGLLFPPDDPRALAQVMHQVLNNKGVCNQLMEKGYERVKKITWRRGADKLLKVFEDIIPI